MVANRVRFEQNQPEIVRLASRLSKLGFTVTDSVAVQHYLQPGFHGLHNDLDLVVHGTASDLPALNKKLKGILPPFEQVKKFTSKRHEVYNTHTESGLRVDLELTDIPFSTVQANLEHSVPGVSERLMVKLPDLNFLVARLMRSVSLPTVGWTRRLDYLTYLSSIASGEKRKRLFTKAKVEGYLRKMCGGEAEKKASLARFGQVLGMVDLEEMSRRTHKFSQETLNEANLPEGFDELRKTFISGSLAKNPLIHLSHAIYSLPQENRRMLGVQLQVGQSDQALMSAVLHSIPAAQKSSFLESLNLNPRKALERLIKKRKTAMPLPAIAASNPRVFIISDTHFDHQNIIDYCHRPFRSLGEMNAAMVANWNRVVGKQDEVYLVGDLALGKDPKRISKWLARLNGKVTIIRGDHDKPESGVRLLEKMKIRHAGINFMLVHEPENAPKKWNGWVIHGHHHNNDLVNFPLVHHVNRTVNVGAELLDYTPISLDELAAKVKAPA